MKRPKPVLVATTTLGVLTMLGCQPDVRRADRLLPGDPAVVAKGAVVYASHCASCHGDRLQGQPMWRQRDTHGLLPAPPHDASGHTWHHPDKLLIKMTKIGVGPASGLADYRSAMPAFEHVLSDEQIRDVLSWIKAQWPPEIQARHDEINRIANGRK